MWYIRESVGQHGPDEMDAMARETFQDWFGKLGNWRKPAGWVVVGWVIPQTASWAYSTFLDNIIKSPELGTLMESLSALLSSQFVVGAVAISAVYAFGPAIWNWLKTVEFTSAYWTSIRPKPIVARVVRYSDYVDVIIWADFENKSEYSLVLRVHGWRAQIAGQAPDYTQPIPVASPLMPNETQTIRFPRIRVPHIGPSVSGSFEATLLIGGEGAKPGFGLYYKVDFEFEEYGNALRINEVQQIDALPQDRVELVFKSASRIKKLREDRGLIIPGIAGPTNDQSDPEPSPAAPSS